MCNAWSNNLNIAAASTTNGHFEKRVLETKIILGLSMNEAGIEQN
jgi:hypothetical protein